MLKLQNSIKTLDVLPKKLNILTGGGACCTSRGVRWQDLGDRKTPPLEARNQKQNARNEFQASTLVPKASVVPSQNFCASTKISWSEIGKKKQSLASGILPLASKRQPSENVVTPRQISDSRQQTSEEVAAQNAPTYANQISDSRRQISESEKGSAQNNPHFRRAQPNFRGGRLRKLFAVAAVFMALLCCTTGIEVCTAALEVGAAIDDSPTYQKYSDSSYTARNNDCGDYGVLYTIIDTENHYVAVSGITSDAKSSSENLGVNGKVNIPGTVILEIDGSIQTYTVTEIAGGTNINSGAFSNSTFITSIVLPSTITKIGGYAFYNCQALAEIDLRDCTNLTSIGEQAFTWCNNNKLNEIKIPALEDASAKLTIGDYAFCRCGASSITIDSNVESIGDSAFNYCNSTITFKGTVKTIKGSAFLGNTAISSITIANDKDASIGSNAFENCTNLKSLTILNPNTTIGSNAFKGCTALTNIYVPSKAALNAFGTGAQGTYDGGSGITPRQEGNGYKFAITA